LIFGVTSERIGRSVRTTLFKTLISKDVTFFDNNRTGNLLSRIGSDTQVVQDGLTTNVAMFIKSFCIVVGTLVILFVYSVELALIVVACTLPAIIGSRYSMAMIQSFAVRY